MANNITARALYDRAKATLINYWLKDAKFANNIDAATAYVETFRLTQSFLRFEIALSTTVTRYQFAVTQQQKSGNVTFNTELLLNLQDSFVVNEIFIGLTAPASATDISARPKTYIDTTDTNSAAMSAIWASGSFSLTVNNEVIIPNWDVMRHYYAPQTQLTGAVNPSLTQQRDAEDGFYPTEPNILLIGSKNNTPVVTLPLALTAVTANARLVLRFRGILAQNSTVVS